MKRTYTACVAGLVLVSMAFVGVAFAHPHDGDRPNNELRTAWRDLRPDHNTRLEWKAELLTMTVSELEALLEDGATFRELAEDQELTREEVRRFIYEKLVGYIERLVLADELTQEQADRIIEWMQNHLDKAKKRPHHFIRNHQQQ